MPPESSVGGRGPSSYGHSDGRSQYRSASLHLSFWPTLLCYTMHSDWVVWCPILASPKGGGLHLNDSLKGVMSATLIICLVEWVQPNSAGSNEKTLWYSVKRHWADSANSRGHNSNPLRTSSSNILSCLCLMVNLGTWGLWGSSSHLATWSLPVALAPLLQPLSWPLGFSFWEFGGRPCYSLPLQLHSCYLSSALCMHFEWWDPEVEGHLWFTVLGSWH